MIVCALINEFQVKYHQRGFDTIGAAQKYAAKMLTNKSDLDYAIISENQVELCKVTKS